MKSPMKFALVLCCAILSGAVAKAQTNADWTLVWSDEFTQPDGSAPDPAKWVAETGAGGWGNNELEYYTPHVNNVRIENGQLVIEARRTNHLGSGYTSARLKTQGKVAWTYGRIEARIKIPRGRGIWPAFWLLGTNLPSVGWPECGEIDIMENIGREPTLVHGTVHGPGYSGGAGIGGPYSLPDGGLFADDFHVYAVEWTTNQIKWFVDARPYFTLTPASLPAGKAWVFSQPQFLLLNLAVGGNWPGHPDATTTFPQRMTVDYVRVYAPGNLPGQKNETALNPRTDGTRDGLIGKLGAVPVSDGSSQRKAPATAPSNP
jgi:beta-glucanase (GH16 family)